MSYKYFDKFPVITYANTSVRNIMERVTVLNSSYSDPNLYYAYDIGPGERADNIADRYYKNEYMTWPLYLGNKIVDPYYGWYLDQQSLNEYMIVKYGSTDNATTKVKYYRNNWYEDQIPLTPVQYAAIPDNIKRFYEPVYSEDLGTIYAYQRHRNDWSMTTNGIVEYTVTSAANFINDEIVDVYFSSSDTGRGQVCYNAGTILRIQHLFGDVSSGTITPQSYVLGRESGTRVAFTTATKLVNNIPANESGYWSPVYYYNYENELNEKNKSIRVLNSGLTSSINEELKSLLK